jgi:arabinan endo-1,5-alpha-L-arabinosidase
MQINRAFLLTLCAIIFGSTLNTNAQEDNASPHAYKLSGDIEGVHDPSIIKDGHTWYLFATATEQAPAGELPERCSTDLHHWKRCGSVFQSIPDWIRKASRETKNLWAPDPSYFNGLFHIYYAYSAFGKNIS